MTSTYPKRGGHFSHKFIRLMARACLGARIGPEACWLLAVIVSTEDAKHYSGPVTFFNANLADQMGVSISSLDRARKKAVAAGWLHYEPGLKRQAGLYWVLVPVEEMNKPDGPSCEDESLFPRQPDEATDDHRQIDEATDEASGRNPTRQAEGIRRPFYPSPNPLPEEGSSDLSSTGSKPSNSAKPKRLKTENQEPHPAKIAYPVVGDPTRPTWMLPAPLVETLSKAFPNLNIIAECRKAAAWCETNTAKRKTAGGMPKFLNSWMNKATNGGNGFARQTPTESSAPKYRQAGQRPKDDE